MQASTFQALRGHQTPVELKFPASTLKAETLMVIQGATTIFQCIEEVRRALPDFTSGDGMDPAGGGNECTGGAKASGSTPITVQVVESNTKAGAASTSVPSFSTEGDGKELTGGGKRGKMGSIKTGASRDVSGGRVS